jgi:hypothetical protein
MTLGAMTLDAMTLDAMTVDARCPWTPDDRGRPMTANAR